MIDSSGVCLDCGYQMPGEAAARGHLPGVDPEEKQEADHKGSPEGIVELNYSDGTEESSQDEIPQWRKELSERLQAIKQKKEAAGLRAGTQESKTIHAPGPNDEAAAALRAEIAARMKARKPAPKPPTPIPLQKTLQPLQSPPPEKTTPDSEPPDTRNIQNLIDTMVSRQPATSDETQPYEVEPDAVFDSFEGPEGKLILLSRTLSGLVDLICVVLCTGLLILAADYFSGIIVLDSVSAVYYSLLFLMTYLVYSLFFLASSSQTVGMMITDLHVVRMDERRPSLPQIVGRCGCYLVSLFGFGIGLLWSLISRKHLCLHDRVSGTQVVRI